MGLSAARSLPPPNYRRLIDEYAAVMPDPVRKLTFIKRALSRSRNIPRLYRLYPSFGELALRSGLLREAERLSPGSRTLAADLMKKGVISSPHPTLQNVYRFRHPVLLTVAAGMIWALSSATASLHDLIQPPVVVPVAGKALWDGAAPEDPALAASLLEAPAETAHPTLERVPAGDRADRDEGMREPAVREEGRPLEQASGDGSRLAALAPAFQGFPAPERGGTPAWSGILETEAIPEYLDRTIWLVEKGPDLEVYSNGLQIITTYVVENEPRWYVTFPVSSDELPDTGSISSEIRGILFHASESDLVPFQPEKNLKIQEYSRLLRQFVTRNRMYHYLIDPFGRVFRIVREEDAAFHAGNSVWADEEFIFLNLNHAFLGICFEGKGFEHVTDASSGRPRVRARGTSVINEAQERSGKMLTDWLRVKYGIPQRNCVPHGLASIYPEGRLIGYHLDLSYGFPFDRFGLRNKYLEMVPAMVEYGFTYDRYLVNIFEGDLWPGIRLSEEHLKNRAALAGMSVGRYRKNLQLRFERHAQWQRELLRSMGRGSLRSKRRAAEGRWATVQ